MFGFLCHETHERKAAEGQFAKKYVVVRIDSQQIEAHNSYQSNEVPLARAEASSRRQLTTVRHLHTQEVIAALNKIREETTHSSGV